MRVKDIMNINVTRIVKGTSMQKAAEIAAMSAASDLAVVDEQQHFLGVVSEGDMMRAALPNLAEVLDSGGHPEQAYELLETKGRSLATAAIETVMIANPLVLHPDDPIHRAAALMAAKGIRRLPVVKDGRLLGTVSRADVCLAVFK
jgi:CBS domain-containing protein